MSVGKGILYRVFNVHESERNTVTLLFFHHFLQGFGLAMVFIVANSLFLTEYSVKELPKVYIVSGLLVMITGRIYAYYEHRITVKKLLRFTVITSFILLILLWVSSWMFHAALFAFGLLAFYQVLYLLYNLEFWGLSALVFDVRQSKRLFGLISSGDMPAKMLGYLIVPAVASFVPLPYLIVLSSLAVLASLYFLNRLLQLHDLHENSGRDLHHHYTEQGNRFIPLALLRRFFKNRFITIAAVLSLIAVITLAAINFSFLSEVKYKFKSDKELASFFGLFFAFGQFFTIFAKAFLSGRAIQWMGIKKALMSLPLVTLIILGIGFIIQGIESDYKHLLYIYGFLMLATEVLNYAVHQPLFLSLFQPLNAHLRLHGHTVIKGFVDGVARVLAGLGIIGLIHIGTTNRLFSFGLVIFALAIIWLIWVFVTEAGYIQLLRDAIRIRRVTGSTWQLDDERIRGKLEEKIRKGRPWEVIYHLELVKNNDFESFSKYALEALNHPYGEVRNWIMQHVPDDTILANIKFFRQKAQDALETPGNHCALIKRVAAIDPMAYEWGVKYLSNADNHHLQAILEGLLRGKSIEGIVLAGNRLIELRDSNEVKNQLITCSIIENLALSNFHTILEDYLDQTENEILRRKVIDTACQLRLTNMFPVLAKHFDHYIRQSWYLKALAKFDALAIDHLTAELDASKRSKAYLESIIYLAQNTKSKKSFDLLLHPQVLQFADLRQKALAVLSTYPYKSLSTNRIRMIEEGMENEAAFLTLLISGPSDNDGTWGHFIQLEKNNVQERIFNLLHILYPKAAIPAKRDAFFSHFANKRANALENLDGLLSKSHKSSILPLLENNFPQSSIETTIWLESLLENGLQQLSAWSLAFCMAWGYSNEPKTSRMIPKHWVNSDWKIIRQQSQLFHQNDSDMQRSISSGEELMELEKVSILKNTTLFNETPENLLVDLAGLIKTVRLEPKSVLFREGDPGDAMFIIHSGKIEIRDASRTLATFGELDFFGELSLLDDEPRSASAIATEESLLLSISQEDFYELITFRTEVAKSVLRVLSQRLRKQNKS